MNRPLTNKSLRGDPAVRRIIASWRELTGGRGVRDSGRRTLVALSGGADSSALAIALAAAGRGRIALGHVVHDMRPAVESHADRDAAAALAAKIGAEFVCETVAVRAAKGNPEASARRLRYEALARMAVACACPFVATAHHADDQAETILMRLIRGAGPRGLRGLAKSRGVGEVLLIRPMLTVARAETERICAIAGWEWNEDATNADVSRLRSRLRRSIMPELRAISPTFSRRMVGMAGLMADAAAMIDAEVQGLVVQGDVVVDGMMVVEWKRGELRGRSALIVGEFLRRCGGGGAGRDRLTKAKVMQAVKAVRDGSTQPREFRWPCATIRVEANRVEIDRRSRA